MLYPHCFMILELCCRTKLSQMKNSFENCIFRLKTADSVFMTFSKGCIEIAYLSLQNLGNFGPLKCKEIYSLDKLRRQADIIEHLITLAKAGSHVSDIHSGDYSSDFVFTSSFKQKN